MGVLRCARGVILGVVLLLVMVATTGTATACAAAVCALYFALPASTDLQDLSSSSELLRTRRVRSFIGTSSMGMEKSGGHGREGDFGAEHFTGSWWMSKGYLYEHSEHLGT